jgi:hypothetical protein
LDGEQETLLKWSWSPLALDGGISKKRTREEKKKKVNHMGITPLSETPNSRFFLVHLQFLHFLFFYFLIKILFQGFDFSNSLVDNNNNNGLK